MIASTKRFKYEALPSALGAAVGRQGRQEAYSRGLKSMHCETSRGSFHGAQCTLCNYFCKFLVKNFKEFFQLFHASKYANLLNLHKFCINTLPRDIDCIATGTGEGWAASRRAPLQQRLASRRLGRQGRQQHGDRLPSPQR